MEKERRDIRSVFLVFSAIFAFVAWRRYPSNLSFVLEGLSLVLLSLLTFSPFTLRPLFRWWMKLAHALGKFNAQILFTLIFIVFFIPMGLVMRALGKDPMQRRIRKKGTYWEPSELVGVKDKNRYLRQF